MCENIGCEDKYIPRKGVRSFKEPLGRVSHEEGTGGQSKDIGTYGEDPGVYVV